MKNAFTIIVLALLSTQLLAQRQRESFTDKRWRVKEFYINESPVYNAKIDSLRFLFGSNGLLRLGLGNGESSPTIQYTYNADDRVITFSQKEFRELKYTVVFFDEYNLVLTQEAPPNQDKITRIEFRMVPD